MRIFQEEEDFRSKYYRMPVPCQIIFAQQSFHGQVSGFDRQMHVWSEYDCEIARGDSADNIGLLRAKKKKRLRLWYPHN